MATFKKSWPWAAIAVLGSVVAVGLWLAVVQVILAVWDPMGAWQLPGIAKVTVTQISRGQDNKLTGEVLALEGGRTRELAFSLKEASELEVDDEIWVLRNYRSHGNRPGHFRLTPARLVLEYPEPWVLLALWGIRLLRRRQAQTALEELPKERKVWRDDFHARSERFAKPKEPGEE